MELSTLSKLKYPVPIWEDLVSDFLEIKCLLPAHQRESILRFLRKDRILDSEIRTYLGFSVGDLLVVVCPGKHFKRLWFYDCDHAKSEPIVLRK